MSALPEAVGLPDGLIEIWEDGVRRPVPRWSALATAAALLDSPIKASRERAAAIRQVCLETMQ